MLCSLTFTHRGYPVQRSARNVSILEEEGLYWFHFDNWVCHVTRLPLGVLVIGSKLPVRVKHSDTVLTSARLRESKISSPVDVGALEVPFRGHTPVCNHYSWLDNTF